MALQNVEFSVYSHQILVFSAVHAACTILMLDKRYAGMDRLHPNLSTPNKVSARNDNYFRKFRSSFWTMANQVEQSDGENIISFSSKLADSPYPQDLDPSCINMGFAFRGYQSPQPSAPVANSLLSRQGTVEKEKTPQPPDLPSGPTPQKPLLAPRNTKHNQQVMTLARKLIEFYEDFDKWHCGLN